MKNVIKRQIEDYSLHSQVKDIDINEQTQK